MNPPTDPPRPEFHSDDEEPKSEKPVRVPAASGGPLACPNCGHNSYTWGIVRGHYDMKFIASNAGFLSKIAVFGGQPVNARKCNFCRNIQLFAGR